MAQKGQNFQLCSWLIKTNGTVWNELATSQGTSGAMHWNNFTDQKWPSGGANKGGRGGPLNGLKGPKRVILWPK